ncbi:hypothetical protein ABH898_002321 [Paenibacillus sp. RC82]
MQIGRTLGPCQLQSVFVVAVSYQGAVQSVHPLRKKEEIR